MIKKIMYFNPLQYLLFFYTIEELMQLTGLVRSMFTRWKQNDGKIPLKYFDVIIKDCIKNGYFITKENLIDGKIINLD